MRHTKCCNGNQLCVVHIKGTDNENLNLNKATQICIFPVSENFNMLKEADGLKFTPFTADICEELNEIQVAEIFELWFDNLRLAKGKKITPLVINSNYTIPRMRQWLGNELYEMCFEYRCLDVSDWATFITHRQLWRGEEGEFGDPIFNRLCARLGIPLARTIHGGINHDVREEAMAILNIASKLICKRLRE